MPTRSANRPLAYFAITLALTWAAWFAAAYLSYQPHTEGPQTLLMLAGLLAPSLTAAVLLPGPLNSAPRREFWDRLLNLRRIKPAFLPVVLLLAPAAVLAATALSLLAGQSASQFNLASQFSFSAGLAPVLLVMFLAPLLEEIGWRGYGVDSLRSRLGWLPATLAFAGLWAAWHLPLFFINHYYQNELWTTNPVYAANFIVSVLPAAVLMNWVYAHNQRSIAACLLLHFSLDAASEMFQTTQFTKCIVTALLLAFAVIVMLTDPLFSVEDQPRPGRPQKSAGAMTTAERPAGKIGAS